jgi:8-oxo-dGTP diphosphatase
MIENMIHRTTESLETRHEVLAAVFSVQGDDAGQRALHVLLWQRAKAPDSGLWALPGGTLGDDEDVDTSARRQLSEKVDIKQASHLEQTGVASSPARVPGARVVATGFLGLVASDADPRLPADTSWFPASELPPMAFDHADLVRQAHQRLRSKLSYTNIAFALVPSEFTIAELRAHYVAALGRDVDPTNVERVLSRRGMLAPTGETTKPGRAGGRPARLFHFTVHELRVTDPFAAFRPSSTG